MKHESLCYVIQEMLIKNGFVSKSSAELAAQSVIKFLEDGYDCYSLNADSRRLINYKQLQKVLDLKDQELVDQYADLKEALDALKNMFEKGILP